MFFPLALVGGARRRSPARPAGLEEVARSLGPEQARRLQPGDPARSLAPGLAAAFCLVFLEVVTELTATLVLVPTGVQTLATQFWAVRVRACSY